VLRISLEDVVNRPHTRHFDREVIVHCVRWYLRYKLSLRDLVKMMAERGLSLAYTTIPTTDHRIIGITRKPAEEIASLAAPTM
jgi:transposase-like protein